MTKMNIPGDNVSTALDIITKTTQDILALSDFKKKAEVLQSLTQIACVLVLASPEVMEVEEETDIFEDEWHSGNGNESPFNG